MSRGKPLDAPVNRQHTADPMTTVYFRQLCEPRSHAYTYLLADRHRREAAIIDPVDEQLAFYLALLDEIGSRLTHILVTHAHNGKARGALTLRDETGALLVAHKRSELKDVNLPVADESIIAFGAEFIRCLETPGHTASCISYLWHDRLFSGDTLLIGDCGACGDDGGNARMLFDSITRKLLMLPDETLVYPAHDFTGRHVSSIGEQRETNPRLTGTTRDEFVARQSGFNDRPELRA